jgi:hypothetical protein
MTKFPHDLPPKKFKISFQKKTNIYPKLRKILLNFRVRGIFFTLTGFLHFLGAILKSKTEHAKKARFD